MAYSNKVIDHYENPRNVGSLPKEDPNVDTGLVGAPECGDVMKLQVQVNPDTGVIDDAKFKTFGCGSAIASSSYLTELVRGMTLEDAAKIRNTQIAKELCLPPVKCEFFLCPLEFVSPVCLGGDCVDGLLTSSLVHCSMLAEDAIKSAISNYYTKNPNARKTDLGGTSAPLPKIEVETVTGTAATA